MANKQFFNFGLNGEQTEINRVPEQKDRGILIDDKLKFVPHNPDLELT